MRRIGLAVVLTLSLTLAPLAAEAQAGKVLRIGVLEWAARAGYVSWVALRDSAIRQAIDPSPLVDPGAALIRTRAPV